MLDKNTLLKNKIQAYRLSLGQLQDMKDFSFENIYFTPVFYSITLCLVLLVCSVLDSIFLILKYLFSCFSFTYCLSIVRGNLRFNIFIGNDGFAVIMVHMTNEELVHLC